MEKQGKEKTNAKELKRVQIDFSLGAHKELEALRDRLEAPTATSLIRDGISVLRWLADQKEAGNRFLVEQPNGSNREIFFNFLERVQHTPQKEEVTARANRPESPKGEAA